MKMGKQPALYVLSSLASWAVDTGLYALMRATVGAVLGVYAEPVCNLAARALSSFFNFNLNNRMVFRNRGSYGKAMLRYYCLAIPQAMVSTGLLTLFVQLFHIESTAGSTAVKITVDAVLFILSFFIQKYWVFAKTGKKNEINNQYEDRKEQNHDL